MWSYREDPSIAAVITSEALRQSNDSLELLGVLGGELGQMPRDYPHSHSGGLRQVKSRVTHLWAQKYSGTKSGAKRSCICPAKTQTAMRNMPLITLVVADHGDRGLWPCAPPSASRNINWGL